MVGIGSIIDDVCLLSQRPSVSTHARTRTRTLTRALRSFVRSPGTVGIIEKFMGDTALGSLEALLELMVVWAGEARGRQRGRKGGALSSWLGLGGEAEEGDRVEGEHQQVQKQGAVEDCSSEQEEMTVFYDDRWVVDVATSYRSPATALTRATRLVRSPGLMMCCMR